MMAVYACKCDMGIFLGKLWWAGNMGTLDRQPKLWDGGSTQQNVTTSIKIK
jgi:hypothetical protein